MRNKTLCLELQALPVLYICKMMTELSLRKKTKENQEVLQPLQNLSKSL